MSRLAIITFITPQGGDVDNSLPGGPVYPGQGLPIPPVYPGQGLPGGGPVDPGYGHPGGGPHPGHGLPGGGHISHLPVFPFDPTRPDQGLPDEPQPGNDLPRPGKRYIVKWLACYGLILVPDHELPETPEPK